MSEAFKHFLEYATSQGYKSNVVKPIMVVFIFSIAGSVVSAIYNAQIVMICCIVLAFILVIAFLFAYFYCLFNNSDLLRSERYNLERTAIEKATLKGDSTIYGHLKLPEQDYIIYNGDNETLSTNMPINKTEETRV